MNRDVATETPVESLSVGEVASLVGVSVRTLMSYLQEQGEEMLQAVQDLKYNDEILEIPATPRPIRVHLVSKTIQQ